MLGFFEEMAKFFGSEFAKNNITVIIALIFLSVILSVFFTSFIFNKFYIPLKMGEANGIKPKYEKVLKENEELRKELKKYENIQKMLEAVDSKDSKMEENKALDIFLKKNEDELPE